MLHQLISKLKNKKGFTLIELIVVIAIIAILAAVLIPRFAGFTKSAHKNAAISNARNLLLAIDAMQAEGKAVSTNIDTDTTSGEINYTTLEAYTGSNLLGTIDSGAAELDHDIDTTVTPNVETYTYTYTPTNGDDYIVVITDGVIDTTWVDGGTTGTRVIEN